MAAIQLNFALRTSPKCKTVHLVGSWNNYGGQIPLSKDPSKPGGWVGTFRFQGGQLRQGQRYWYYYIIDNYHASHDPARESTTEPTTGRKLNILDIPTATTSSTAHAPSSQSRYTTTTSSKSSHGRRNSEVPKGRSLSPSQIQSPFPSKPYATRTITSERYSSREIEALAQRYAAQQLNERNGGRGGSPSSDSDSDLSDGSRSSGGFSSARVPSLSSRSSNSSSPSSISSGSCCVCERFAITRVGARVKLDCGGARCGYSDASSECSSESDEEKKYAAGKGGGGGKGRRAPVTRRQGIVVRR